LPGNGKSLVDKPLTDFPENDLASFLAQIVREHPDLSTLIEAWPVLSGDIRTAILRIAGR